MIPLARSSVTGMKSIAVLGAGKMGEACIRHLAGKAARSVLVSNRSHERAIHLAKEFGGRAVRFEECHQGLMEADIVVSSTGCPQTILDAKDVAAVMQVRPGRPLFLIDIAVPRDIDPDVHKLPNVYLYNVDHVEQVVRDNLKCRQQEVGRCKEIIAKRATAFLGKINPPSERAPAAVGEGSGSWVFSHAAACAA